MVVFSYSSKCLFQRFAFVLIFGSLRTGYVVKGLDWSSLHVKSG